jgi:hypothetical protein
MERNAKPLSIANKRLALRTLIAGVWIKPETELPAILEGASEDPPCARPRFREVRSTAYRQPLRRYHSRLVNFDRPDVLQALLVLSKGGIRAIQTPNSGDLEVDVGIGTISLIELE